MRRLFFYLLILTIAISLGLFIQRDPGAVLILYQNWVIEMPLWFAIVALIGLFFLLHQILKCLHYIGGFWSRCHQLFKQRRQHRARILTHRGLIQYAEGQWKNAEYLLVKAAKHSDTPLVNYLAAARAAQEQGLEEQRNHYLQLAQIASPEAQIAIGLTQAELQKKHQQFEQSLATLKQLQQWAPRHPQVLNMLKDLYVQLKDWHNLKTLIPDLRKQKVLPNHEMIALEADVECELLDSLRSQNNLAILQESWRTLPRRIKKNSKLIQKYAELLLEHHQQISVETLLYAALKQEWHDGLGYLYGTVTGADPDKQLLFAESWLKKENQNPVLLQTLSSLCVQQKLWGKARRYLELSLALQPSSEGYHKLAELLERLGDKEAALASYRKSSSLAI